MSTGRRLATLVTFVAALGAAAPAAGAAPAAELPELASMVVNLPRVNFNFQVTGGEAFTVTLTLDRPAPAGGTRVIVRKFRDTGPIYTLPTEVTIAAGTRTTDVTVGTVPVDPNTATATHQQISATTTDGNTVGNVTLFDSLFVVPRPVGDPRGNPVTTEAENASLAGARIVRESGPYALASNDAYVVYTSGTGRVDFAFTADRTGTHWLIFRYAFEGFTARTMRVTVNATGRNVTFGPTAGASWYQLTAVQVPLRAGANQVRVAVSPASAPVNLDFVQIAVP